MRSGMKRSDQQRTTVGRRVRPSGGIYLAHVLFVKHVRTNCTNVRCAPLLGARGGAGWAAAETGATHRCWEGRQSPSTSDTALTPATAEPPSAPHAQGCLAIAKQPRTHRP